MASDKGTGSKIIEIGVNHAKLNPEKKGKYYVDISVEEGQCLRTMLRDSVGGKYSISWNQKFVFSVPNQFIFDEHSSVSFTLFRARKCFPDCVVGEATSQMKALFPIAGKLEKVENVERSILAEANYDTEEEEEEDCIKEESPEKEAFQLTTTVGLPILKGSSVKGTLDIYITAWEKYYPGELNWYWRNSKAYQIFKGSEHLGSLYVEKAVEEKYVSYVGKVMWRNLAMEYEEFMMDRVPEAPRPKRSFLLSNCLLL